MRSSRAASLRVGLSVGAGGFAAAIGQRSTAARAGVAKNQPVKLAAFEGLYQTDEQRAAARCSAGWTRRTNGSSGRGIPGLLSFLTYGDTAAAGGRPARNGARPQGPPARQFHVSTFPSDGGDRLWHDRDGALGVPLFLARVAFREALDACGCSFSRCWGRKSPIRRGWFAAEVGRQPWIVYGLLRTSGWACPPWSRPTRCWLAMVLFSVVYLLLFAVFVYLLNDKIQHGPDDSGSVPGRKLAMPEGASA